MSVGLEMLFSRRSSPRCDISDRDATFQGDKQVKLNIINRRMTEVSGEVKGERIEGGARPGGSPAGCGAAPCDGRSSISTVVVQ